MRTSRYFLPLVLLAALLIVPTGASRVLAVSTGCQSINDSQNKYTTIDLAKNGDEIEIATKLDFAKGDKLVLYFYAKNTKLDFVNSKATFVAPDGGSLTAEKQQGIHRFTFKDDATSDVKIKIKVDDVTNLKEIGYKILCAPAPKGKNPTATDEPSETDEPTDFPPTTTVEPTVPTIVPSSSPEPTIAPTNPPTIEPTIVSTPEPTIVSTPEPTTEPTAEQPAVPSPVQRVPETVEPPAGLD